MKFENIEITKSLSKTKVDTQGKVYIPAKIRELCGIKKNSEVNIQVDKDSKAVLIR